jgi:hypothetical protein
MDPSLQGLFYFILRHYSLNKTMQNTCYLFDSSPTKTLIKAVWQPEVGACWRNIDEEPFSPACGVPVEMHLNLVCTHSDSCFEHRYHLALSEFQPCRISRVYIVKVTDCS